VGLLDFLNSKDVKLSTLAVYLMLRYLRVLQMKGLGSVTITDPLRALISMFRYQKVTDSRDIIYALLGLAEQSLRVDNEPVPMFGADYSKKVQQVFKDLVFWHI
jgi:hypothetical protein